MYCVVVRHKGVFLPQDVSSNTVMQLRTFEQYTCWDCEGGGAPGAPPSESATDSCTVDKKSKKIFKSQNKMRGLYIQKNEADRRCSSQL